MVTILYGLETGNAQEYARFLARRLRYLLLKPTVSALDSFPPKMLVSTSILIIICSTTGQGEVPRNGKRFMKFLRKRKLPPTLLNHIQLTTFGLGDSSYPKFNHAIRKIHSRLLQLGCTELSPRCESDEMLPEGADGYYAEWEANLLAALKSAHSTFSVGDNVLLPPECPVSIEQGPELIEESDLSLSRNLQKGRVSANRRMTAEGHFQDVRLLKIESEAPLEYLPGDTIALYPKNDKRSVEIMFECQPHWKPLANLPLTISGTVDVEGGLVLPLTLRTLLEYHVDLTSIPRRLFFSVLHHFVNASTPDGEREKEKLFEFSILENLEDLYNYANRPRRLILETLMEFAENLTIPVEYIVDLFPLINPRLFLIASKPNPHSVELVVGLVEYKTMLRRIRRGLCSKWIKGLEVGHPLVFGVGSSNLDFGSDEPLILVAPGTGVAPMKSLVEHTIATSSRKIHLFYGCRYRDKDFLFADLWDDPKVTLHACFSRDGGQLKYVQDGLFHEKKLVGDLIVNDKAVFFLCGSSGKMPRQVRITIVEILKDLVDDAEAYVATMENTNRYIQETW